MTSMWMFPWIASVFVIVFLTNRWRRSRVTTYLYASYAVGYLSAVALVLFMWLHPESRGWSVLGVVYLVSTVPLFLWMHRREVRKYGSSARLN